MLLKLFAVVLGCVQQSEQRVEFQLRQWQREQQQSQQYKRCALCGPLAAWKITYRRPVKSGAGVF